MPAGSPYDQLAGLDAMVLQFNTPTSSSCALDGIPYVTIPRPAQRKAGRRSNSSLRSRTPLQDKTQEYNLNKHTHLNRSTSSHIPTFAIRQDLPHTPPRFAHTPSFHPLPPLPSASPLQLPSFMDISYRPHSPSVTSPLRRGSTSTPPPSRTQAHESLPQLGALSEVHDEPYCLPTLQHPNSPYVPWASPIRREFLRPLTPSTIASGTHRHPTPLPDFSTARSPTPQEQPRYDRKREGLTSWQHIGRFVKQNVGQVAKRLTRLAKPLSPTRTRMVLARNRSQSTPSLTPRIHFQTDAMGDPSHTLSPPRSPFAGARSRSPSRTSMMSTDTNSLALWLAARQRQNMEQLEAPLELTLEEYELMGSWLDIAGETKAHDQELDCGVPGCEIHSTSTNATTATSSEKIATQWSQAHGSDSVQGSSLLGQSRRHESVNFRSFPHLPSLKWFESADETAGSLKAPTPRRPLSMPGGWASL